MQFFKKLLTGNLLKVLTLVLFFGFFFLFTLVSAKNVFANHDPIPKCDNQSGGGCDQPDYTRCGNQSNPCPGTGFTAQVPDPGCNGSQVTLKAQWSSVSGAASYDVIRIGGGSSSSGVQIASGVTGTSYIDQPPWPNGVLPLYSGANYSFWINAKDSGGSLITQAGSPWLIGLRTCVSAPVGFCPGGQPALTINWTDAYGGEKIYRNGVYINTVANDVSSYIDTGVISGGSYYYSVETQPPSAEIIKSDSVSATAPSCNVPGPPPGEFAMLAPSSVCIINTPDNKINWTGSSGATHYFRERWGGPGAGTYISWLSPDASKTSWDDSLVFSSTGPVDGYSYTYRITAFNQYGSTTSLPQFVNVTTTDCQQPIVSLRVNEKKGDPLTSSPYNLVTLNSNPYYLTWLTLHVSDPQGCQASTTVNGVLDSNNPFTGTRSMDKLAPGEQINATAYNTQYIHKLTCFNNNVTLGFDKNNDSVTVNTPASFVIPIFVFGTIKDNLGGVPIGVSTMQIETCPQAAPNDTNNPAVDTSTGAFNFTRTQGTKFCVIPPSLPGYTGPVAVKRNSGSSFTNKYDYQVPGLSCASGKVNFNDQRCTAVPQAAVEDRDYIGDYNNPVINDTGYDFVYTSTVSPVDNQPPWITPPSFPTSLCFTQSGSSAWNPNVVLNIVDYPLSPQYNTGVNDSTVRIGLLGPTNKNYTPVSKSGSNYTFLIPATDLSNGFYTMNMWADDNATPTPNNGFNTVYFKYNQTDCSHPYFTTSGGDVHSNVRIKQPVP